MDKPTNHRPVAAATVEPSLETEAITAPESAWFFAWIKTAGLYLAAVTAYFGIVTGFVAAWTKLIKPGEKADLAVCILAGILALPILFAFFFNLLPAIRRRRERHLRPTGEGAEDYFDTAPREGDPFGFFNDGYESFVNWARMPKTSLLHLTGLSGSGKSSLLTACLLPRLAPDSRLLIVRSYHDPLAAMKEKLLTLWMEKPKDYDQITPLDALHRAARQLGKNERLLVAFDQFEEFFLLRALSPEKSSNIEGTAVTPVVPENAIAPLRKFLSSFCNEPPHGIALLLSYREDHRRLISSLALPARVERDNWMTVDPLDFAAAATFLRSCPRLAVPDDRMQRILREAARQEGGRIMMRPIVANLLGLVLRQMSVHPTLWRRTDDLLRGYVRDSLGTELREERALVLRTLLTDFHTARPRTATEIASETGLDLTTLDIHLEHLGRCGLLRCVNRDEPVGGQRIWQIAHDFLATLVERVLDALHRTVWRIVRPWLAPTAVGLALVVGVIWPWVEKQHAISLLANAGFTWNEKKSEIVAANEEAREIEFIKPLKDSCHLLHPRRFILSSCYKLQNVDVLKGLTSLQSLKLRHCTELQNADGLKGLTSLQRLELSDCGVLHNVDGLNRGTAVQVGWIDINRMD